MQEKRCAQKIPGDSFGIKKIRARLKTGDTVGCFYLESPAMRQLLGKLRCDDYLTLVAASSIIRPGVASSGMMRTYIERHRDSDTVAYPHPVFKEPAQRYVRGNGLPGRCDEDWPLLRGTGPE
ncbi:MAG: hypothetical protein KL787_03845 [Taibaiella sp.]|nr:hypothetical protein [Taibaiella sp.]